MAEFIYTGLEPDPFGGNDSEATAGDAGVVGAYLDASNQPVVVMTATYTGDVETLTGSGAGSPGPDPADFAIMTVGGFTETIQIGFEIDGIGTSVFALLDAASAAGGSHTVSVTAVSYSSSGAGLEYFSHTLTIAYGAASAEAIQVALSITSFAELQVAADAAYAIALEDALYGVPDWTVVDETVYLSYVDYANFISDLNSDLLLGTFDGDSAAYVANARNELQAMLASLPNFPGPQHPSNQAFNAALRAAAADFLDLLDVFFSFDYYLDGVQVDPEAVPELTTVGTDYEWSGEFAVDGPEILFETTGSTFYVMGAASTYEAIDYGVGVGTLSYTVPATGPTAGDDSLPGSDGPDSIDGLGGDDTLIGYLGNDTLDGGAGRDRVVFASDNNIVVDLRITGAQATGEGNDQLINIEDVMSGAGDDILTGNDAANLLSSNNGADQLNGLGGNDTLRGGSGNDTLNGGDDNDLLEGSWGNDLLLGGSGRDTLSGGQDNDTIHGGGGHDLAYGGTGDDLLTGFDGFDTLSGGTGLDTLLGNAANDRLFGGAGNDLLRGGAQNDNLFGENGNDTLFGEAGFDRLDGGDGNDLLNGGGQADNLLGRGGNDTLLGGDGLDRLFGGVGDDSMNGGAGNDGLFGNGGRDNLFGHAGDDRMFGGVGFDTLNGGTGNDELYGNFNADTFVFAGNHGNDTIRDFDATSDFEVIDVSGLSSLNSFADVQAAAIQIGGDVRIDTGGGNSILLIGVNLGDLGAGDFSF